MPSNCKKKNCQHYSESIKGSNCRRYRVNERHYYQISDCPTYVLLNELIYFVLRVRDGSIISSTTYNRYVRAIEYTTGQKIENIL
jgi:hypothetical protein